MTEPPGHREVVGVLLAAGLGTRFSGGNKLLARLPVEGETVVRRAAERLADAPVSDAAAVLGHEADRIEAALDAVHIQPLRNPAYEAGHATSVRCGVEWARERDAEAVLFALGDMPWVAPSTYRAVVDTWRASDAGIVVPTNDGRRGNPVAFGARHFDALAALEGDTGGRALMDGEAVERVAVDDPGIHRDVDRVGDLAD